MRKLKLDVESLTVQTFQPEERPVREGTVFGAQTEPYPGLCTAGQPCGTDWITCANTCETCEGYTCMSCEGTCNLFCTNDC